jgi:hypothetical protein
MLTGVRATANGRAIAIHTDSSAINPFQADSGFRRPGAPTSEITVGVVPATSSLLLLACSVALGIPPPISRRMKVDSGAARKKKMAQKQAKPKTA